ncbi:MAG: copper amine oxidase N-terminal domain-containing protein [Ruminococcaceae bacterium]|nr:copper amine oxidase N-terminal domain-containing protein [Oscillospiraceae bacterium]
MKKFISLIISVVLIFAVCLNVSADSKDIKVLLNGTELSFDVPPQIIKGRTMVPVRKIFEAQGADVEWIKEKNLIVASHNTNIITMRIGEASFSVTNAVTNETTVFKLDVPAQIINGRTLVPARAISEALGNIVDWDGANRTVVITDK